MKRQVINWEPIDPLLGIFSDGEIGKKFNIPSTSALRRRQKLGIHPAPLSKQNWGQIDPLLGTMPDGDIAKQFNCHAETIRTRRKQKGVAAYRKITNKMIQQWIEWEQEGIPQSEIAKRSGVNPCTVWKHLKRALNKPKFGKFSRLFKDEWKPDHP